MENSLVYSFRTFPHLDRLRDELGEVHVLGNLKEDIDNFCDEIMKTKPRRVLGVALDKKESRFEKEAVNQFHGNKKVLVNGRIYLKLHIPYKNGFRVSERPSYSFCNYSMYKIQHFLNANNLKIPFSFIHLHESDINNIKRQF